MKHSQTPPASQTGLLSAPLGRAGSCVLSTLTVPAEGRRDHAGFPPVKTQPLCMGLLSVSPLHQGGQETLLSCVTVYCIRQEEVAAGQRAAGFATGENGSAQKLSRKQTVQREIRSQGGVAVPARGLTSPRMSARPRRTSVWGSGLRAQRSTGPVVTRRRHQAATTEKRPGWWLKRWLGQLSGRGGSQAEREEEADPSPSPRASAHPALRGELDGGGGIDPGLCPAGRPQPSQVLACWPGQTGPQ